ncbi:MAG: hypothetical protein R6W90_16695, partial [Ignavibacteriaceae bacterium]
MRGFFQKMFCVLFLCLITIISTGFAQPSSNRSDITIRQVAAIGGTAVRVTYDPVTEKLYLLENDGDVRRVDIQSN